MRTQKRRVPAERARHAKRLGHVQAGSGHAFPVVLSSSTQNPTPTSSSQVDTTTASTHTTSPTSSAATHSSTSASTSSSSASTSSTTSLTSSVASLTNTQSITTTVSTPSLTPPLSTVPTLATSTTPTSLSSSATTTPVVAAAKSGGLSGGAVAGIIAGAAVVGVALIVFFVRKTVLRRREHNRVSWTGAPGVTTGAFPEPRLPELSEKPASFSTSSNGSPMSPFEPYGQSIYTSPSPPVVRTQTPNVSTYTPPAPPPATLNNPTMVGPYPHPSAAPAFAPGSASALAMARPSGNTPINSALLPGRVPSAATEATVRCTFVPSLPDELSITAGERVRIVARFDDSWALCANGRGEQGMVPQECLEAPSSVDWGNGQRLSSLNPDGRSY